MVLIAALMGVVLAWSWEQRTGESSGDKAALEQRLARLEAQVSKLATQPPVLSLSGPAQGLPQSVVGDFDNRIARLQQRIDALETDPEPRKPPAQRLTRQQQNNVLVARGEQWFDNAVPDDGALTRIFQQRLAALSDKGQLRALECRSAVCKISYETGTADDDALLQQWLDGEGNYNAIHAHDRAGHRVLYLDLDPEALAAPGLAPRHGAGWR